MPIPEMRQNPRKDLSEAFLETTPSPYIEVLERSPTANWWLGHEFAVGDRSHAGSTSLES